MPRRKAAITEQPFEATSYEPVADDALLSVARLEQLVQEIAQLHSGDAKTYGCKVGKKTVKVKVWEAAN